MVVYCDNVGISGLVNQSIGISRFPHTQPNAVPQVRHAGYLGLITVYPRSFVTRVIKAKNQEYSCQQEHLPC